ncbi:MAG: GGDEF domain-containing protein [Acidimicrobiales bacterium]|nr:GGDEF domain-containing protein [Acidimicrobiales bacterium]
MTARNWTRAELGELVRGRVVCARDELSRDIPVPEWLARQAGEVVLLGTADFLDLIHSDDLPAIVDLFVAAAQSPNELLSLRARSTTEDDSLEITLLNLLHHPDVAALLFVMEAPRSNDDPDAEADDQRGPQHWIVVSVDGDDIIRSVDGMVRELLGYRSGELVGRPVHTVVPSGVLVGRTEWTRKDGGTVVLECSSVNRPATTSETALRVTAAWDVSSLQQMADDLRAVADEVPAAMFRCDLEGQLTLHNSQWNALLTDQAPVARLHDLLAPAAAATLDAVLHAIADSRTGERRILELEGIDGTLWEVSLRAVPGPDGAARAVLGTLADVTVTTGSIAASLDSLTGLLSRTAVQNVVDAALADGSGSALVVFIDLDGFASVNESFGHDAGDAALIEVANRLRAAVRPGDALGRWGGDEFVVVFADATRQHAQGLLDRLGTAFEEPIRLRGGRWQPAASFGVASPAADDDVASVLRRADHAMLAEKRRRSAERHPTARR